mgnify:CR=1 FL=1
MTTRYLAPFPERQMQAGRSRDLTRGQAPVKPSVTEKTAAWPRGVVRGGAAYNRRTKADVVKTHPTKAGVS